MTYYSQEMQNLYEKSQEDTNKHKEHKGHHDRTPNHGPEIF